MLHCSLAFWILLLVVYCSMGSLQDLAHHGLCTIVIVCATCPCSLQVVGLYVMNPIPAREVNRFTQC